MALAKLALNLKFVTWDVACTVANFVVPARTPGKVTPAGVPGEGGKWPEYIAPKEGDSRCSCPALNAMANHGILPRDGKNIKFTELEAKVRETYNFAPSFCYFVPSYSANMLGKNFKTDSFDLVELDLHNGIEHDASLTREDVALVPDQSKPHIPFIRELLDSATGKDADGKPLLTIEDLSRFSAKRRVEARETNPDFTLESFHKRFGSANSATLLTIYGGRVEDLESVLIDERIPDGWESRILEEYGLTFLTFNIKTVGKVEKGIDEEKYIAERKAKKEAEVADAPPQVVLSADVTA